MALKMFSGTFDAEGMGNGIKPIKTQTIQRAF
jgi:hypothetical protein